MTPTTFMSNASIGANASPGVNHSGGLRLRATTQMSVFLRKAGNLWLLVRSGRNRRHWRALMLLQHQGNSLEETRTEICALRHTLAERLRMIWCRKVAHCPALVRA